jgi:hypothetical protein
MGRRQSVFNKRSQDQVAAARNKPTVTGGGLLPTAHAQSASNPTQNRLQQAAQRKEGPLERAGRFIHNIGVGGYGTVRGYTTDMYTAGRSLATGEDDPVDSRSYRDDALVSMASRGIMEGKYDEVWEEAGRRVTEEPGRVVGEVAAETAIMLGTMGFGAAWKGGRIGMGAGRELSRLGQKGYLRNTGYFRKGTEAKFIGDRRTIITTTSHKGKVKTRNKRTNMFDRIERKAISLTEKYNKNKKIPKIITPSGSSVLAAQTIGGGVIGARNARGVGGGFAAIGGGGAALQDNVIFKGGMTKETLEAAIKENTIENKIQSLTPSGDPSSLRYGDEFYGSAGPMKTYTFNTYKENRRGPRWKQYPKGETVEKGVTPGPRGISENISFIGPIKKPSQDLSDFANRKGIETKSRKAFWKDAGEVMADENKLRKKGNKITIEEAQAKIDRIKQGMTLPYDRASLGKLSPEQESIIKYKSNISKDKEYPGEIKDYFDEIIDRSNLPDNMDESKLITGNPFEQGSVGGGINTTYDHMSGISYDVVDGLPAFAQSTTKDDTRTLVELSLAKSFTDGDSATQAMADANQYVVAQMNERSRQNKIIEELYEIQKARPQATTISGKYDEYGNLITGTPAEIEAAEGIVLSKTVVPGFRQVTSGTDTGAMKGLTKKKQPADTVFRPLSQGLNTREMVPATREEELPYTGVIKIISGGQTGVDQTALAAWYKRKGITGGTMPRGWQTENSSRLLYTAENTTSLKPNQIFVYGANKDYKNYGGAAGDARRYFGAGGGNPEKGYKGPKGGPGIVGQSYGVITKKAPDDAPESFYSKTPEGKAIVKKEIKKLVRTMRANPDKEFILTDFGTQMAGFKHSDIVEMFGDAILQPNAVLPKGFYKQLKKSKQLEYDEMRTTGFQKGEDIKNIYGMTEGSEGGAKGLAKRMEQNIIDSDVTIVFGNVRGKGTAGTIRTARDRGRPVLINPKTSKEINDFTKLHNAQIVNIAGTRGSHIDDPKVLKHVSKMVKGIKQSKTKEVPKGRRKYSHQLFLNTADYGAGDNIADMKNIFFVPQDIARYSWASAKNASGKGPMITKIPKNARELDAMVKSDFDYMSRQGTTDKELVPGVSGSGFVKVDTTPAGYNFRNDYILRDLDTYRASIGMKPVSETDTGKILGAAMTDMRDPTKVTEYDNWRVYNMEAGQNTQGKNFETLLWEAMGESVVQNIRGKSTRKPTRKQLNDLFQKEGASDKWMAMRKKLNEPNDTRTDKDIWTQWYAENVTPTIRNPDESPVTMEQFRQSVKSGTESYVNVPIGSTSTANVLRPNVVSPDFIGAITTSIKDPKFDPVRLWRGWNYKKPDPYRLADKAKRAKDQNQLAYKGKGKEPQFLADVFGTPSTNVYGATDIIGIGTFGPERGLKFTKGNNPFNYPKGSPERRALIKRNKEQREQWQQKPENWWEPYYWGGKNNKKAWEAIRKPVGKKKKRPVYGPRTGRPGYGSDGKRATSNEETYGIYSEFGGGSEFFNMDDASSVGAGYYTTPE